MTTAIYKNYIDGGNELIEVIEEDGNFNTHKMVVAQPVREEHSILEKEPIGIENAPLEQSEREWVKKYIRENKEE